MKEINEEIKLTLSLMQTDIDDGAHSELQFHLYNLLDMKRDVLRMRLVERAWAEPVTRDESRPLTAEELKAGGWWCADTSENALKAFLSLGFKDEGHVPWDGSYYGCFIYESGCNLIDRGGAHHTVALKQIHRIGNDFYWGDA